MRTQKVPTQIWTLSLMLLLSFAVRGAAPFSDANWASLGGIPGVDNQVQAAAVDSSGNLYISGYFVTAGNVIANGVAKWDGSSWSALGTNASVTALAISGTNVYAAGSFTTNGIGVNGIAEWDGSRWSPLALGVSGVDALAVSGNNFFVGGDFTTAGGVAATNIAKWDGSNWSALGLGLSAPADAPYYFQVFALVVSGTNLYAGGSFGSAGGIAASNIAKWTGAVGPR